MGPSSSNSPNVGRDDPHYIRLLKAPSKLVLNTSRDEASPSSLGHLFPEVPRELVPYHPPSREFPCNI